MWQPATSHTVKPWFNGRVDVAPPVIDLTAESTLLGGRLDYIGGEPVAAIVYQRRKHVINLFVAQHLGARHARTVAESVQGYNVRHWSQDGLDFWVVATSPVTNWTSSFKKSRALRRDSLALPDYL